ncbi:MAG: PAS domain S-box protein [Spirochaeta sp.]
MNGKTVLLVEDQAVIAIAQQHDLEMYGYTVYSASSGIEAISLIQKNSDIEIVLMDIDLGEGIDGIESARRILAIRDIPIVFLSSNTEPGIVQKTEQVASYGYVVKNTGIIALDTSLKMAFRLFASHANRTAIIENSRDYIWAIDTSYRVLYANRVFQQVFKQYTGIELQEGTDFLHALPEKIQGVWKQRYDRVLQGEYLTLEETMIEQGIMVCLEILVHPIYVHSTVIGISFFSRDITARQKLEQQLRLQEERLNATLESIGDAVIATDTHGMVVRMNPVAAQLTGWPQEEALEKPLQDVFSVISADTREKIENPVAEVIATGRVSGIADNTLLISRDGTEYQIGDSAAPIRDSSDSIIGAVLVFRDVTEEYRMRTALDNERLRLQTIVEASDVGTWEWNIETGEVRINRKWATMLGYTRNELQPVSIQIWYELVHPEDLERSSQALARHFRGETSVYECEVRIRHKDGYWIWILDKGTVIARNSEGEPQWMYGTHTDISRGKQVEAELSRTASQNQVLLRELQHRTKNSFSMIFSMIELMRPGYPGPESQELLDRIRMRIEAVSAVYTLLYEGNTASSVNLDEYISRFAPILLADSDLVRLEYDSQPILVPIQTAIPIGLIVNELLTNALKHAFPDGRSGTIRISILRDSETHGRIVVCDNGNGIPDIEMLETGDTMGLQLVRSLTEQIDGSLDINPEKGFRCSLIFPVE